ncbi:MAG TPA: hypothetical protein DD379_22705 [Cyanobacteria bacterium UBA11162]|nr:hypothetical protein [Cyanobacteria bacterium UBA11162]
MNYFTDAAFEFETSPLETILLEETLIEQARELCCSIQNETRYWQAYLNTLALFAFEEWLLERAPELPIKREHCSIFQPRYANIIEAVFNLKVGEFKLCIMAMGSLTDKAIAFPRAVIELPEFAAHFYVVLEVIEELDQATLQGFIRYDRLIACSRSHPLQAEPNWTYRLPLTWFESNTDELLRCLRFLEPDAIALPPIPTHPRAVLSTLQAEFSRLLPQLQSHEGKLWEILTWEQAAALLTNSELLNQLFTIPQGENEQVSNIENKLQTVKEPIVNVGLWLRDEIDELAQKLSWVLLPAFAPEAVPLRSPTQELEVILKQLERTGTTIPPVARGAYTDFKLAENSLRLYAVTWPRLVPKNIQVWTLLLILGAEPGTSLSCGVKLLVSDETQVLLERVLEPKTEEFYLYAQAVGRWDEEFTVTLSTPLGASVTFPPFVFRPN